MGPEVDVGEPSAADNTPRARPVIQALWAQIERRRFYRGSETFWRAVPFAVGSCLPLLLIPVAGLSVTDPGVVIALVATPIIVVTPYLVPWRRLPKWMQAIPPLAFFGVVALLRHAAGDTPS